METQQIHKKNQVRWEAAADNWAKAADTREIWNNCHKDPSMVFVEKTMKHLKDVKGQEIAVLGSGDNEAVFALAGMGAKVTSIDISQKQLDHAMHRAIELGLEIDFIQQDVTNLDKIENAKFDKVYTGGHVAVWVGDLDKYYEEASRILKTGGVFIIEEYHPFRRVWEASSEKLKVGYPYFNRGPFEFHYNDDVLYPQKGKLSSYEFHWTISDYCTAVIKSGCQIIDMYEYGDTYESWEVAPFKGLPEIFTIVGRKNQ